MVVAKRQLTILAVKSVTAEVIAAGRADTVASPLAERTDNLVLKRNVPVHGAALAHRHVVRRIKAGRSDISDRTGKMTLAVQLIAASEGITVVLHQPQVMTVTEFFYLL